jgi:hypothetical protein
MRWRLLAPTLILGTGLACDPPAVSPPGTGVGGGAGDTGTGGDTGAGGAAGDVGTGGAAGDTGTGGGAAGHPAGGAGATGGSGGGEPAAFQYDGSVAFAPSIIVTPQRVQISAPILPRLLVIYTTFPADLDGEKKMAHNAALLFDWLLPQCAPLYPKITLAPSDGTPLTPTQLAVNYDQVGLCAYMQYTSKPYWIPKLIDDVDICGTEMGVGWRLITEADIASLTEADFQRLADTWSLEGADHTGLGFFFASLAIWVRADDGTIKAGTLAPGVAADSRVMPLGVPPGSTAHYEGNLGLRCIRRTDLP